MIQQVRTALSMQEAWRALFFLGKEKKKKNIKKFLKEGPGEKTTFKMLSPHDSSVFMGSKFLCGTQWNLVSVFRNLPFFGCGMRFGVGVISKHQRPISPSKLGEINATRLASTSVGETFFAK
ncbi:MAG: hypothetical protein Q4C70_10105 [Planctomycetia bacterium]|nr:hypothetical protein [Planctomycetia bacterium]